MPFEIRGDQQVGSLDPKHFYDETLLWQTHYSAVEVYPYREARFKLKVFCQSASGDIYEVEWFWGPDTSKDLSHTPEKAEQWKATRIVAADSPEAAAIHTALVNVVTYRAPGNPTLRLYYRGQNGKIREMVWQDGTVTNNCLGIVTAPGSALSVITYETKGTEQVNFRLYFQAPSGMIQEYKKQGTGAWTAGETLSFPGDDTVPLPGTSLVFVNRFRHIPSIRGFYQNRKGAIKEVRWDGGWYPGDFEVSFAPYRVPIAVARTPVKMGDESGDQDSHYSLFHTDAMDRIQETRWDGRCWQPTAVVDIGSVAPGSRLAAIRFNSKNVQTIQLFATGLVNSISKRRRDEKTGKWDSDHAFINFGPIVAVDVDIANRGT